METVRLTLCMIVKNEAHNLARCLDSASHLAGEIVVVDTGSTDATPQIAASYGARVVPFDFTRVDFAAARNHSLEQATGEWILVLDADEALEAGGELTVKSIIESRENAGFFLERHNYASGIPAFKTDHVVRLFPNRPAYRYHGRVHETVDASILKGGGKLIESQIQISHRFIPDRETRRRKNLSYIEILKEEIAAHPEDLSRLDFLAAEYHQLEMYTEATEIAERLAQLRPDDARAHLFAGTYHLLFKPDFPQATLDFLHALSLQPNYPEAEFFLRMLAETSVPTSN